MRNDDAYDRVTSLKTPPHSIQAEQAVLAALMLDNSRWDAVAELIKPNDFYRKEHRLIFDTMTHQQESGRPIDVITISETLRQSKLLGEAGGIDYLSELMDSNQSAANIVAYAGIIHERAILRHLIGVGHGIADSGYNPDGRESEELVEIAENAVFAIADQLKSGANRDAHPIKNYLSSSLSALEQRYENKGKITGKTTGFRDLDEIILGMRDSQMITVAGRPSMGKTSLLLNIAEHVAITRKELAIIFSIEMPASDLTDNAICSIGRIDNIRYRRGTLENDDWEKVSQAITKIKNAPLYIDDDTSLTSTQLIRRARRISLRAGMPVSFIGIDYLQLLKDEQRRGDGAGEQRISTISMNIKNLAREMKCPVVALSQLNRSLEQRPNKRPIMSDLRGSGSIEQDSDVIIFIYRDEVYNQNSDDKGIAELIVGKARGTKIGMAKVATQLQFYRFENMVKAYKQPNYELPPQKSWLPDD